MRTILTSILALLLSYGLAAQSITVTQPNGGELLYGCQTYNIKWTASGVSNWYDIHYSLNGGTTWTSVATNINITNNQYAWSVPMINSSTVLVRVMDHQALTKRDSSNGYFTVQLPINITSPDGSEVWQGLSTHTINWTPAGTSGFFNIFYSIDNGTNWITVATNVNANNYIWNVPNNPSPNSLVKVQDATTSCQFDVSNAVFEISPATPVLNAPNGGEVWTINSSRNITWNTSSIATGSNVKLEWSVDNGANYNLITASAPNTGTYAWTVPNTPSGQCFIRISNANGLLVNDISNSSFSVIWPGNFITSPNGGETWRSQNTHNITWDNTVFVSNVKIEYSVNNGSTWTSITSSTSNTGSYPWTIPFMTTTTQALIRITNTTWPSNIIDTSNAVFTILAPVTVDYPNTGTSLTGCSNVNIQWSRTSNFNNHY
ncbi:MAG TPA: hypothetical protein PLT47_09585, partial [Bacteroidales bacterium]|nr:hypothetical protein [Bacteroidales bacterium]